MKLNIDTNFSQPDPYVIVADKTYYMYVTGFNGVGLFISNDLKNWERKGICYTKQGQKHFWAPCVIKIGNHFYMYVSSMSENLEDTHEERIQVAVSDKPEGPYRFVDFLIPAFSIDPHVVKSGNKLFMYYSTNDYEAERAGTYIVVDKMISPVKMEGKPSAVIRPTLDEEIYKRDRFKKGQHWHTLEGAFYFRKDDYHYLMYSGNCFESEYYYIGYAVAYSKENDLTKLKFHKYPNDHTYLPLIKASDVEEGTGHNSLLKIKDKYYVFYHGRDIGDSKLQVENRTARICEISVEDGIINVIRR